MRRSTARFLACGVLGALATFVVALVDVRRALLAWTSAYGFLFATVLAGLVLTMILRTTRATWWLALRPAFALFAASTPLLVAFFLPVAARPSAVFPWASASPHVGDAAAIAHVASPSTHLPHALLWNTPRAWFARAIVYLATWGLLALAVHRCEAAFARSPTPEHARRARMASGAGLPILAMTMTFASFDWLMSIESGWVSSIYGLYVFASGLVSAIAVVVIATWLGRRDRGHADELRPDHVHALGRLLLMSVILWAYLGFFQFLLVWIADLPHEIPFYAARATRAWTPVALVLIVGRFVVPLLWLLSRERKRRLGALALLSAWLVLTTALDFAWLVLPSAGVALSPVDLAPFLAVVGFGGAYATRVFETAERPQRSTTEGSDVVDRAFGYRSP